MPSFGSFRGASCAAIALGAVLAGAPAPAGKGTAQRSRPSYVAAPELAHGVLYDGTRWVAEHPLYEVRLTPLDDAGRQAFLRETTGAEIDPFATPRPEAPDFWTFELELKATGAEMIIFQPQRCQLKTDKLQFLYPLDLPTIESAYRIYEGQMPEAYRRVEGALLDGERTLTRGQRVRGLLVYEAIDPRAKRFAVEVVFTTGQGSEESMRAVYVREKKKKKKDRQQP